MPELSVAFTADDFSELGGEVRAGSEVAFASPSDSFRSGVTTTMQLRGRAVSTRGYRRYAFDTAGGGPTGYTFPSRLDVSEPSTLSEVKPWWSVLSLEAQLEAHKWPRPCSELFTVLASHYPGDLIRIVESGLLSNAGLTFAAEALGAAQVAGVDVILAGLLRHGSAMVREGALYGLHQLRPAELAIILRRVSQRDPSEAVRSVAADLISDNE